MPKKWKEPPTYKKFGDKTYKLKTATNGKRGAEKFAKRFREEGRPTRIHKAIGKDGEYYYLIYTR